MAVGFALLFASAGRGTAVALVAGTAVTWAAVGRTAWPVVRALAVACAAGLALFAVVFLWLPWLTSGGAGPMADYAVSRLGSDQARGYLWQVALDQIRAAPWLGIGPMHAAHWPNLKAAHPHNLYLQVAAEWGLPMALLLLAVIATAFARLGRCLRSATHDVPVGVALAIGCVAVLVDGLVSGNFVMPVSQVWIAVLAGWTVAWCRANPVAGARPGRATGGHSRWVGTATALLALVAHLWLAASIAPEVEDLAAHLSQSREAFPSERTQPRFWSHGRF
jgi:O-antigen ligase